MLLALDTSSPTVSVALLDVSGPAAVVVASRVSEQAMRHGEQLAPLITAVLDEAGRRPADLTGVAAGAGPGPFTGLRVGLVTARTLGLVLGIPVRAVCSLDVLAAEAIETGAVDGHACDRFVVATDARRKEVYWAAYDAGGRRIHGPAVDRPADVATADPVVGEGALLYPTSFSTPVGPLRPSAGRLGLALVAGQLPEVPADPLYLRRPDAVEPAARPVA